LVKPVALDLQKIGAHYAVSTLFEDYEKTAQIFCYGADRKDYQVSEAGGAKLAVGRVKLTSEIVRESAPIDFGVLHFGDHNLEAGVCLSQGEDIYRTFLEASNASFKRGDLVETLRMIDEYFGKPTFSIQSLFRDEQRKIVDIIQDASVKNMEAVCRQIYENNAPFLRFLKELGSPPPKVLMSIAEFILNVGIREKIEGKELKVELIETLVEEAKGMGVSLDGESLEMAIRRRIEGIAKDFVRHPTELPFLDDLDAALGLLGTLPFRLNLREVQKACHRILRSTFSEVEAQAREGDKSAFTWVERFISVCESVSLRVDQT
jgi:hypothetical protein